MAALQLGADERSDHALHRPIRRPDDGNVAAEAAGGGSDLAADQSRAADDDACPATELAAHALCVFQGPQDVPASERPILGWDPARSNPSRDHQPPEVVLGARTGGDDVSLEVGAADPDPEHPGHVRQGGTPREGEVGVDGAADQGLLGQWRPVVRRVGFVADHGYRSAPAVPAKCLRGTQPGQGGPDDDHRVRVGAEGAAHSSAGVAWWRVIACIGQTSAAASASSSRPSSALAW